MFRRILIPVVLCLTVSGCGLVETLSPVPERFERLVVDCGSDTTFVIENGRTVASASFEIHGNLSHPARVYWDYQSLDTLTKSSDFPATTRVIELPQGEVKITHSGDYYSKKLFVKYIPLNDSTAGELKIKVKI